MVKGACCSSESHGNLRRWDLGQAAFYSLNVTRRYFSTRERLDWKWLQADLDQLQEQKLVFVFMEQHCIAMDPWGLATGLKQTCCAGTYGEAGSRLGALVWVLAPQKKVDYMGRWRTLPAVADAGNR